MNVLCLTSAYSTSSSSPPLPPSLRMGIFIPCAAKHLLNGVLSQTPGNFFAEYTWKTWLKHEARMGTLPLFIAVEGLSREPAPG